MRERTKEILKFLAPFSIPAFVIPMGLYMLVTADPDLTDYEKREAIHHIFENDAKSIQLPNQFRIRNFEKGGKPGSSILDKITLRTRMPKNEAVDKVNEELNRLGWSFWKKEESYYVYCKRKFSANVYITDYLPENSTDATFYFMLGLNSVSGADVPKKCLE